MQAQLRQVQISIAQLGLSSIIKPSQSRSAPQEEQHRFKKQLAERYRTSRGSGKDLICLVTGAQLPSDKVIAARILSVHERAESSWLLEGQLGFTHLTCGMAFCWQVSLNPLNPASQHLPLAILPNIALPASRTEQDLCAQVVLRLARRKHFIQSLALPFEAPPPSCHAEELEKLGATIASCCTGMIRCSPLAWCSTCWTTASPMSQWQTILRKPDIALALKVLPARPATLSRRPLVSFCGMQSASTSCLPVPTSVMSASLCGSSPPWA